MTGCAFSHSLMVYSPGNWPLPWNICGNFLMTSSADLIGAVFFSVGDAGVGPDRMAGPGMSATYQQFIW